MKWTSVILTSVVVAACSYFVSAYVPQEAGHRDEVIKFNEEVWKNGNMAYIDEVIDPEFVRYGHVAEGNTFGIAAFKDRVQKIRSMFTDYSITLVDMMGVGDKAVFTWKLRGNYVGPDKKISPGRLVELNGKTVWFFKGKKLIKEIVEIDADEYYRQIQMAVPYSEVENRALLLSYLYEVMSKGNVSALDELVATSHTLHDANNVIVKGIPALRDHVNDLKKGFPDLSIAINEIVADGNLVTARWTITGTQKGEWLGIAPTNTRIEATGLTFTYVKDGKMQETWSVWDTMKLRQAITKN